MTNGHGKFPEHVQKGDDDKALEVIIVVGHRMSKINDNFKHLLLATADGWNSCAEF